MKNAGYKEKFVKFLLESRALAFGDFTLKSGRKSPYMVNTGRFNTGPELSRLGCFYAKAIYEKMELGIVPKNIDVVFGASYKGIPLATATVIAFSAAFEEAIGFCFNRKEPKDHGEGGILVGRVPQAGENVLIIDDVLTAGTALRETVSILKAEAPEANIVGCVISVDRMERGTDNLSAVAQAQYEMGFPVFSIVDIQDVLSVLKNVAETGPMPKAERESLEYVTTDQIAAIETYVKEYRPGHAGLGTAEK
jgi:orotate phosphoribosyltransferase